MPWLDWPGEMDDDGVSQHREPSASSGHAVEHIEPEWKIVEATSEEQVQDILILQYESTPSFQELLSPIPSPLMAHAFERHAQDSGIEVGLLNCAEEMEARPSEFGDGAYRVAQFPGEQVIEGGADQRIHIEVQHLIEMWQNLRENQLAVGVVGDVLVVVNQSTRMQRIQSSGGYDV